MDMDILPCRRCGCKPELIVKQYTRLFFKKDLYILKCNKCGQSVSEKNETKVALLWNRNIGSANKTEV